MNAEEHAPTRKCIKCNDEFRGVEYMCPPCDRRRSEAVRERVRSERIEDMRKHARRLRDGLPFADCEEQGLLARIRSPRLRRFAERHTLDTRNVVLVGDTGIGKTTALAAVTRRALSAAIDGTDLKAPVLRFIWMGATRLATAAARHPLGQSEPPDYVLAKSAPVLVIDDLGADLSERNASRGFLHEVLDARYLARVATLVTSGFPVPKLRAEYGEAALRRCIEPDGLLLEDWGNGGP